MRESYTIRKYKAFLSAENLSTSTVDNYLVDAIYFLQFLGKYLTAQNFTINKQIPATYLPYTNQKCALAFNNALLLSGASKSTITRRIAGVKKFLDFAVKEEYLAINPIENFKIINILQKENPRQLINNFKLWLKKQNATDTTIKNYASDIRHFLNFYYEKSE